MCPRCVCRLFCQISKLPTRLPPEMDLGRPRESSFAGQEEWAILILLTQSVERPKVRANRLKQKQIFRLRNICPILQKLQIKFVWLEYDLKLEFMVQPNTSCALLLLSVIPLNTQTRGGHNYLGSSHETLPSSACINTSPKQGNGFSPRHTALFLFLIQILDFEILLHGAGAMH